MFKPCDVLESLGHFNSIVASLVCILMKQRAVRGEKCPLKTPANAISDTRIFKMFPDASALKNLCFWCEFQSRLLFIITLLLKNFLTALNRFQTWQFYLHLRRSFQCCIQTFPNMSKVEKKPG